MKYDKILKDNFTREEVMINMANKKLNTSGKISKQRKLQKTKTKRKSRKLSIILIFTILLAVGICAYLLTSPRFNIQEISINGNSKLSSQQISGLAEIKNGDNIFSKLSIVMKVKLKQNGYIEDVEVNKIYPNKVEINVTERKQQFQIKTESEGYIYIDEQGYILEYAKDKIDLPVIIGMNITINKLDTVHRLGEEDLEKMENILQIREQCKNIEIADKITQYEVSDEYIINLENDTIVINLGDATNLKNRMYYVNAILKQEVGNKGVIYVNGDLNEGFSAYFRANQ
ncbi:MAG: FtsQ-type POTRA domain-containing protein [Clostridia bacterium]|nr:FtsQ-type POTRA domain-containing protein [Clostridia bacterium]